MNYYKTLAELESINTTHLSDKDSAQVAEFEAFVTPLIPDIRKGDAAKAKIAEFYLEHKSQYTDGCVKVLEPLINQLGVSAGYISQLKKAKEYKDNINNPQLKSWVAEHPVSIQYHIAKAPHATVIKKFKTGENCSFRETQEFKRLKKEEEKLNPVTEETKTHFQLQQERYEAMVESDEKPLIRTKRAAACLMAGTRKDVLAAAAQVLLDVKYEDNDLEKIL